MDLASINFYLPFYLPLTQFLAIVFLGFLAMSSSGFLSITLNITFSEFLAIISFKYSHHTSIPGKKLRIKHKIFFKYQHLLFLVGL